MEKKDLLKSVNDMDYRYYWLSDALDDMSREIGYVYSNFGIGAARKAEIKIRERVGQLCAFPDLGIVCGDVLYKGNVVRVLHIKQVSVFYSVEGEIITLIAVWNNRQDISRLPDIIGSR